MELRWAFLVPTIMILVFLVLGYALDGPSGLRQHYNMEVANLPVILVLAVLYIIAISVWFKMTEDHPKVVTVRTVRMR